MSHEQVKTMNAVGFGIKSVVGPNGQGIAITFLVCSEDGRTEQQWPPVFVPSENAEQLAQGILQELRRLKSASH